MTPGSAFRLRLARGPQPGQIIELGSAPHVFGREPGCNTVLDVPGVSRRHARLLPSAAGVLVEDLGSSNGTYVNGERLSGPRHLAPGDQVSLGHQIVFVFESGDGQPAMPTAAQAAPSATQAAPQPAAPPGPRPQRPPAPPARPAAPGATMLGDVDMSSMLRTQPPHLVVEVPGQPPRTIELTKPAYSLGRSEDNDIAIESPIVSRRHARLDVGDGGYSVTMLPEARNPVWAEGRVLTEPRRLQSGDVLRIGGSDASTMVTLRYLAPAAAAPSSAAIEFGERTILQIGRDPTSDIRLDTPQISRFHAQVERVGQRYRLRDLRSSNGTFVNGQRVEGEFWLKPNDQIRIGPYRLVLGETGLAGYDESRGLRVDLVGLNKWVRKDLNILQNISLAIKPREFVVVVGQSGGGKSTLVDAVAGYRPATHGRVYVNGIDVYKHFDAIRYDIGFVPQRDIIHMELTVFQALDFAAQLRMPPDTRRAERHQRVMEVLQDLDLAHRKDVQISGLSGGQQKRVSIGVELLTKPGLFFLDEPTSGLDPGTETALMQLMRHLADQGRTIILITHATKNVMLADKVIFLARGGYLAWYGPPEEALRYFDQYRSERERRAAEMEFDEIYAILDNSANGKPVEWAQRFQQHAAYQQYVIQPLADQGFNVAAPAAAPTVQRDQRERRRPRQVSSIRQFFILSARNVRILIRDRSSLFLMLAAAPIVGLLDVVLSALLGRNPFDVGPRGNVPNVMITLFLLTLYGVLVGGLAQMREFVKELDIYKRERLVNLKIVPYVVSKIWVAALLALYQTACYAVIHFLAFDMPGNLLDAVVIYITLSLATMAGMMLGLFASALAPNANSAPLIVIIFMLPQIVLGGALIALPGSGQYVSALTTTRWSFEALMSTTGVGSDVAADVCWALPEELRKIMTLDDKAAQGCRCMGIGIFSTCQFPGVGRFYDPKIEDPQPQQPPDLRPAPPEPVLPPKPVEPENQADQVAMADYFEKLEAWENEVGIIQANYQAELKAYQDEAGRYQVAVINYQRSLADWRVARAKAVEPAEGLISQINRDFGWTFVNKEDTEAYWTKILGTWSAQGVMITILFVLILILQKRKDVV